MMPDRSHPDAPIASPEPLTPDDVETLRAALREEAPLPLGMRSRIEARTLLAIHSPRVNWGAHLVIGCVLFLVLGAQPEVVVIGPLTLGLFAAVALYVRLLGAVDEETN